jgi:hypothetical protein
LQEIFVFTGLLGIATLRQRVRKATWVEWGLLVAHHGLPKGWRLGAGLVEYCLHMVRSLFVCGMAPRRMNARALETC